MLTKFHGVVPAMATPFNRDLSVDEKALAHLIEGYLRDGVHGISLCGSQGEFFSLDHAERVRVMELGIGAVRGRVPTYYGVGAATTREAIELTRAAESMGADVALVINPAFISPSPAELLEHFSAIARSTRLPVMLYNNPPRTHTNITPALFEEIARIDNVVGIKDSSGDVTQSIEYMRMSAYRKIVFAGRDTIFLSLLVHGGAGAISPAANVFPRLVMALYERARAGRWEEARAVSDALAPLRAAWEWGSFPVVIKEAMALVGRSAGPPRAPILPLRPEIRERLKGVVDAIAAAEARVAVTADAA